MSDTLDQDREKRNENVSETENRNAKEEDAKNTSAKKGNNSKSLRVSQTEP